MSDEKNSKKKKTPAGGRKKKAEGGKKTASRKKTAAGKTASSGKQNKSSSPGSAAADNAASSQGETKKSDTTHLPSHVVGIGSSAGGLEALKEFFQNLPANTGMAFILVPHLDPTSKSMMHDLLQKFTSMSVEQVRDNTTVEPDSVYVIPPDRMMGIMGGSLQLMESEEKRGLRHPIDYFFRSLAQDQGENAIGIILSGSGTEGVLGTKAVKGEGGVVFAQDPESAKFDSMPSAAIATGMVDWILPPHKMPKQLLRFARKVQRKKRPPEEMLTDDALKKIFMLIRGKTGHDFSLYKPSTILRRITRRMDIHQMDDVGDYISYLQKHQEEVDLLFRELLIRVTNFFRDPAAFSVFQEKVLPNIMENAEPDQQLRIWVPACSTGEEAYSIAMAIDEYMNHSNQFHNVQIFATDIDEEAVEKARRGIYPESIGVDVSEERLQRYFTRMDKHYQVKKVIRESIVFAVQNIIKDPPLSRMDLICCRNLLIYFNSELQHKVMAIFHYALKPRGLLFLGASETIGSKVDLFSVFDSKWKIFRAVGKSMYQHTLHFTPRHPANGIGEKDLLESEVDRQPTFDDMTRKLLLDLYAPASVIMRDNGTILYFYGRTGKYLEPAEGKAKLNIHEMARQGLKNALMEAVKRVKLGQQETRYEGVRVKANGNSIFCTIRVMRISKPENMSGLILVVFEQTPDEDLQEEKKKGAGRGGKSSRRVAELEQEIKDVREHLQTTIEELETSNEELQSTNEELQSTNEELETSREELQSVNEELMTVNAEAQEKIEQLTQARDDMKNLLASTEIATVFLDTDLRVKNSTPDASRIFKLIESDVGRPISDITNSLEYDLLEENMHEVLDSLIPFETQVLDSNGFWYLMKILPYRTQFNYIDGVVLTFVDITKQKIAEASLAESEERRTSFLEQSQEGYIMVDSETGSITDTNESFQKLTGKRAWELKDMKFWDLVEQADREKVRQRFYRRVKKKAGSEYREKFVMADGDSRVLEISSEVVSIGERKYLQCFVRID